MSIDNIGSCILLILNLYTNFTMAKSKIVTKYCIFMEAFIIPFSLDVHWYSFAHSLYLCSVQLNIISLPCSSLLDLVQCYSTIYLSIFLYFSVQPWPYDYEFSKYWSGTTMLPHRNHENNDRVISSTKNLMPYAQRTYPHTAIHKRANIYTI